MAARANVLVGGHAEQRQLERCYTAGSKAKESCHGICHLFQCHGVHDKGVFLVVATRVPPYTHQYVRARGTKMMASKKNHENNKLFRWQTGP